PTLTGVWWASYIRESKNIELGTKNSQLFRKEKAVLSSWLSVLSFHHESCVSADQLATTTASASISTSISDEISALIWIIEVEGRISPKNSPCALPIFSQSA